MADRLAGKYGATDSGFLFNVTKDDANDLPHVTRGLIVGTAGDIKITDPEGNVGTYTLPAGQYAVRIQRLWSTGTTATGLVGIR